MSVKMSCFKGVRAMHCEGHHPVRPRFVVRMHPAVRKYPGYSCCHTNTFATRHQTISR